MSSSQTSFIWLASSSFIKFLNKDLRIRSSAVFFRYHLGVHWCLCLTLGLAFSWCSSACKSSSSHELEFESDSGLLGCEVFEVTKISSSCSISNGLKPSASPLSILVSSARLAWPWMSINSSFSVSLSSLSWWGSCGFVFTVSFWCEFSPSGLGVFVTSCMLLSSSEFSATFSHKSSQTSSSLFLRALQVASCESW